jgi:hypothetical protein
MELEPSGLRTHEYAAPGWHNTYNQNFNLLNEALGELISDNSNVLDVEILTDGTEAGDNYTATEKAILNALVTDVMALGSKINDILGKLRELNILKGEEL